MHCKDGYSSRIINKYKGVKAESMYQYKNISTSELSKYKLGGMMATEKRYLSQKYGET